MVDCGSAGVWDHGIKGFIFKLEILNLSSHQVLITLSKFTFFFRLTLCYIFKQFHEKSSERRNQETLAYAYARSSICLRQTDLTHQHVTLIGSNVSVALKLDAERKYRGPCIRVSKRFLVPPLTRFLVKLNSLCPGSSGTSH
jgi:hypothetical protein